MLQTYNPANADLIVNINGRLVHRDEAGVSPFDSAVQNGDAVWEGLRLYGGRIFKLQEHLDRLRKSAGMLRYQGYPSDGEIVDQLKRTLAANGMTDSVHVRLTVSRGIKYTSGLDPRINTEGVLALHPRRAQGAGLRQVRSACSTPRRSGGRSRTCSTSTSTAAIS